MRVPLLDTGSWGARHIQGHLALALPWPASDCVLLPSTLACPQQERAVPGLGISLSGPRGPSPPALPQRRLPPLPPGPVFPRGALQRGPARPVGPRGAAGPTALLGAHQGPGFARRVFWDLLLVSGLGRWRAPGVQATYRSVRRQHRPVGTGSTVPLGRRGWFQATCLPRSSWQAVRGHGKLAQGHSPDGPENGTAEVMRGHGRKAHRQGQAAGASGVAWAGVAPAWLSA